MYNYRPPLSDTSTSMDSHQAPIRVPISPDCLTHLRDPKSTTDRPSLVKETTVITGAIHPAAPTTRVLSTHPKQTEGR